MANELIRPIDANSARAIEEASKAAAMAIEAAMQTGKYVGAVLGDLPHDLVGIIGDWVAHKRARRWAELQADTEKILRERGVENRENVSPSVAIPLIAAAINEDREVLKQMWAKLLAAAMDPARANRVRVSLIEALKNLDPLDARVLLISSGREAAETLATLLGVSRDEVSVSLGHLVMLNLAHIGPAGVPNTTPLGNLLLRAIED